MIETEWTELEQMLQANYQFLDFSNPMTHFVWFDALKDYDVIEVRMAVKDYIKKESKTPTVADMVEFILPLRERKQAEREHNRRLVETDKIECKNCNDVGFIRVFYPTGVEAVRPCDCEAGHRSFGKKVYDILVRQQEDEFAMCYLYGGKDLAEAVRNKNACKVVRHEALNAIGVPHPKAKGVQVEVHYIGGQE